VISLDAVSLSAIAVRIDGNLECDADEWRNDSVDEHFDATELITYDLL